MEITISVEQTDGVFKHSVNRNFRKNNLEVIISAVTYSRWCPRGGVQLDTTVNQV